MKHRPTNRTVEDHANVTLFLSKPPSVKVNIQRYSIGIIAEIENIGIYNATYINWTMSVSGGILQRFERLVTSGNITILESKSTSEPIKSGFFIGFSLIHIVIAVDPENLPAMEAHFKAFKFGPFILNAHPD